MKKNNKLTNDLPQIEVYLEGRPLKRISVATVTILQNEAMELSNEILAAFLMGVQYIVLILIALPSTFAVIFSVLIVHCFKG